MDFEFQNIDSLNVLCTKKKFSKKIRFKNAFFLVRLMFYARKKNFRKKLFKIRKSKILILWILALLNVKISISLMFYARKNFFRKKHVLKTRFFGSLTVLCTKKKVFRKKHVLKKFFSNADPTRPTFLYPYIHCPYKTYKIQEKALDENSKCSDGKNECFRKNRFSRYFGFWPCQNID